MNEFPMQLLVGSKGKEICNRLISLQARFPKLFPQEFLHKVGRYLFNCPTSFLEARSDFFLCKLFFNWYRLAKKNQSLDDDANQVPQIAAKCLLFEKDTLGIAIVVNSLKEDESFNENHILLGINNLIPGVRLIPLSYVYVSNQNHYSFDFYLEVKKMKGGFFSPEEKKKLQNELLYELEQRIEKPPSLILTENIEDLFKNIQRLSHEIKHIHALPQVMMSCIEYSHKTLKFLVVAVRVVLPSTHSISTLRSNLPSLIHFSLEKTFCVGQLRQKYPKEAAVFTLELRNAAFLRNNNELNLREARQYVAKALENMLGVYRDFTGGFLNKENEQLEAIRSLLDKKHELPSRLFVDLFYGIKPITTRVLISPHTGVKLAMLLEKQLAKPLQKDASYRIDSVVGNETHIVMIKTTHKQWKISLPQRILACASHTAYSYVENEGYLYLCFFQEHTGGETLSDLIQRELKKNNKKSFDPPNKILRINFQGGDPLTLNPRLAWNLRCHLLSDLLFEGLTRINVMGQVEFAAAENVTISPDGLSYTFHLRASRWSNGEPVTAFHFEDAWKRAIMENATIFIRPDFFYLIKNVGKYRKGLISINRVGISVPDARTLCVELERPCPYFINVVSTPQYYPLLEESEEPSQFNGAFALAEWERDRHLYLTQNPYYWNAPQIKLGGVMISMVADPNVFYQMFLDGELDLIDSTSPLPSEVMLLPELQKHRIIIHDISRVFWIHCNTQCHPLNHIDIRRALNLSVNRTKLAERVFAKQMPHFSLLPPKYSSIGGNLDGDIFEGRAHLQRALDDLKLTVDELPPIILTHSNLSFECDLAEELREQWKEALGLNIISRSLSWNDFSAALDQGDFQLAGIFRRDLLSHPVSYLSFFTKSLNTHRAWSNKEFDKIFASFDQDSDQLQRMERILIDEVPIISLVNQTHSALLNDRIKNLCWTGNGCFNLQETYIYEETDDIDNSPYLRHTNYVES